MSETKHKILDVAERLFAEQGFAATSLRHIIAEAGVNLAAIHYHFGSKEELLDELVGRFAEPVNAERIARLDRLEAEAGGAMPPVEPILEAFLMPPAEMAHKHPESGKMMGRLHAEGLMPTLVERHFKPTGKRFIEALRRALPALTDREFQFRIDFMIGAMAHTMVQTQAFQPGAAPNPHDWDRVSCLVAFLSGGFNVPASMAREGEKVEVSQ
jgi:AcrR family transcriptional regulator